MNNLIDRIEALLTPRNARLTLVLIGLVSVMLALPLRNVRLDHDFERFFPTDDPELDRYLAYRAEFGYDNDFLLIGVADEGGVFQLDLLRRVDSLAGTLAGTTDIRTVLSPTRLKDPRVTPVGVFEVPWLRLGADSTLAADSARIWEDDRVREGFFAGDGRALLMVAQTEPGLSKERSDAVLAAVEQAVARSGLRNVRLGGRIHGQYWYIQKMQRELVLFTCISIVLLSIFLYTGFRTAWGVLVPVGVVGLTVLWQVGGLALLGKPLSVLTMLLPTILFVVGMSDVVHIIERYIDGLRAGLGKARALAVTYHEVGLATFLTSITTAIGFATLTTSSIPPIRDFGLYTAIGVMLAFMLAFTLLPAILLLAATPVSAATSVQASTWYRPLHRLFQWTLRHRRAIPLVFLAFGTVSLGLITQLKVDNFLLEDWPEDDPQKQDYYWFEDHFGGVRPFEMEVRLSDSTASVWDLDVLHDIERVEEWLHKEHGIRAILSPAAVVRSANQAMNGGDPASYVLPDDPAELRRLVKRAMSLGGATLLGGIASENGHVARISGRMRDEGGYIHRQRDRDLQGLLATLKSPAVFKQTGMAFLIDLNNEKLSSQLIGGLAMAFVLIGGIMAWVFGNWRMTLIAMLPNIVPLLFVGGIMALSGIDIKVSTAIIFTIAFGIAVDDTIHLLGKLRIELKKGRSLPYAMKRSVISTGKAVIITSIMLCSGFIALIMSDFASVFYMGLLVSLTLALAVVADLLLLPVLVVRFLPVQRAQEGHEERQMPA